MIVDDLDPATGEQWRIVFAGGHASGRTDGKVTGVPEAPKTMHVFEAKSMNDRAFKALLKAGCVREGKPEHFAQVQTYLHCQGLTRALYLGVNKNTDELYCERIEYEVHLSSQADQLLDELQATVPRSTTSPGSAQQSPMTLGTLWSVATASSQDLEFALRMFSRECSGPH